MAKDGQIKALRKVKASQVPMELGNKGKKFINDPI